MGIASIQTNIQAGYASQNLRSSIDQSSKAAIRMSSGMRITRAADDASGLSIGTGLKTDVATLRSNLTNTSQALAILSIVDGALSNVADILQRMKAISSQANSGSMGINELSYIDLELDQIADELDRVSRQTSFNSQPLLDGSFTNKNFQVGFGVGDVITVALSDMTASTLGISATDLNVSGGVTALVSSIAAIDSAIDVLKTQRASVGAMQSRFGFASSNLETSIQNTDSARADYLDADLAAESSVFSNSQVRIRAGVEVLSQVNQLPQSLLRLLTG